MKDAILTRVEFLLGYIGFLAVGAIILIWDALARTPFPSEMKWGLLAYFFIGDSYSVWRREHDRADAAEATLAAELAKPKKERVFAEEPQALLEHYGHSGMLAQKLITPYLDKWITVSGRFEVAADSLLRDAILLSLTLESGRRIHLQFAVESRDRLEVLREGQQVTAVCQVQYGVGLGVYVLENCELIRVERLRPTLARAS
jgi:hypothetical protein